MVGSLDKSAFKPDENYEEFYAGHKFEPMPEPLCYEADTVIPRVAWAVDVAREIGAKNVLDLCCLDGFALLTLAHKLSVTGAGVDLSWAGTAIAAERAKTQELELAFVQKPVEELDWTEEEPYDLVLLFEAIEHFTDPDKVMAVIKAHLKPGGTLLVSTPDAEGYFGIRNTEDTCHLRIYSHREDIGDLTAAKPVISLPAYLRSQGFHIVENDVYNDLIHIRATMES